MNILVTIADDQRHSALSCCDGPTTDAVQTPNLDRLAERGVRCSQAYHAGSPHGAVCMPSRAMLHSGRGSHDLPPDLMDGASWGDFFGEPSGLLLGTRLQEAGYHCHAVGKWHNGQASLEDSFESGSQLFLGGMYQDNFNIPLRQLRDGQLQTAHPSLGVHATDAFTSGALQFLEHWDADRSRPFFLYVAFTAPHDPRQTHEQWHDRYPRDHIKLPPNFSPEPPTGQIFLHGRDENLTPQPRDPRQTQREIANYYAMIEHLDHGIGRIHHMLEQLGVLDETLIVHTADHGLAVGQHGILGKQNVYDHSIRVPLIAAGPNVVPGQVANGLCYQHDLYPTLLEAADATADPTTPYRSLWPMLANPSTDFRDQVQSYYSDSLQTVSDGKNKTISFRQADREFEQHFDLEADPWETQPLTN